MQTKIHTLPDSHPVYSEYDKNTVFLDIETTGLSPKYHRIYLISMIYFESNQWNLVQCFADKIEEEKEVLFCIFALFKDKSVIISYNGNRFDLPFLNKRAKKLNVKWDFATYESIDLYEKMKQYQFVHGIEKLSLARVQHQLGIIRKDIYRGVDCINFYREYQENPSKEILELLLLHNYEDVYTLPQIGLQLKKWQKKASFHISNYTFTIYDVTVQDDFLEIKLTVNPAVTVGNFYRDLNKILIDGEEIVMSLPVNQGLYDENTTCTFLLKQELSSTRYDLNRFNDHGFPQALVPLSRGKKFFIDNLTLLIQTELNQIVEENSCESSG